MSPAPYGDDVGPVEKRARHKTRPDRYETKKRKITDDGEGRQNMKAKRTKISGKKKFVSSREVMDNFTSDAILTEGRLTVSGTPEFPYTMGVLTYVTGEADPHARVVW